MKPSYFQLLSMLGCVVPVLLVFAEEPRGGAKTYPSFRGVVKTDVLVEKSKDVIAPLAVFFEKERTTFPAAHKDKPSPDEFLTLVASEGKDLMARLGLVAAIAKKGHLHVDGKPGHEYRFIVTYPHKDVKGIEYQGVIRFSSGKLTTVREVMAKFGPPSERELWTNDTTQKVGLNGLVGWWGSVGIAATKDGQITHVLVREAPSKGEDRLATHKLSENESKQLPIDKSLANTVSIGNLFDNETNQLIATDDEIKSIRAAIGGIDFTKREEKVRLVKQLIDIVGGNRARKIGLVFRDEDGRAKYVWPSSVEEKKRVKANQTAPAFLALGQSRTWTDRNGKKLEAEFVSFSDGKVSVKRKRDGKLMQYPLERLSDSDQAFVKSQPESAPKLFPRSTSRTPWVITKTKLEKLEGGFVSGGGVGAFGNSYSIQPAEGRVLVKATFSIAAIDRDPQAVARYKTENPNLSKDNERKLTGNYRMFSLPNLRLRDAGVAEAMPVYIAKPPADSEIVIGKSGVGSITARAPSSTNGWLHSNAVWIADGATLGEERVAADSSSNAYRALCQVGTEPVEVVAIFIADSEIDVKGARIQLDE